MRGDDPFLNATQFLWSPRSVFVSETATAGLYTAGMILSLHDALRVCVSVPRMRGDDPSP